MKLNLWLAAVLALLVLTCCGGTPATAISTSTAPSPGGPPTAGSMAEKGRGVYAVTCSPCHGPLGQGSSEAALIGPGSDLAQYGTTGALLDFISRAMPYGDPGAP